MTDNDKVILADILTETLHKSMSRPNARLKWRPGSSMANFIDALEILGVDFSNVNLSERIVDTND